MQEAQGIDHGHDYAGTPPWRPAPALLRVLALGSLVACARPATAPLALVVGEGAQPAREPVVEAPPASSCAGPEDRDGFEDADGCADPDNDHDRILDTHDRCPNEPETFNGFEDEDGCPDRSVDHLGPLRGWIGEAVHFGDGASALDGAALATVDAVARLLAAEPGWILVDVEAHTDERGDAAVNLKVSRARAAAVRDLLVRRGVDPGRLRPRGYGEWCPRDPGHDERAWAANRRVEFKVVVDPDGPTGIDRGCSTAAANGVSPDGP